MPKEEWGTKRVCPTTGKRFYDLNKDPIVSPYTGEVLELDTGKRTMLVADAADGAKRKAIRKRVRSQRRRPTGGDCFRRPGPAVRFRQRDTAFSPWPG